jgi:hypothetical protein
VKFLNRTTDFEIFLKIFYNLHMSNPEQSVGKLVEPSRGPQVWDMMKGLLDANIPLETIYEAVVKAREGKELSEMEEAIVAASGRYWISEPRRIE